MLGGQGFIGTHLVNRLLEEGYIVRCFDRPHVEPLVSRHIGNPNFEYYEGDFASEADVDNALEGCDLCFHLISTTLPNSSNLDPIFDLESNVISTVRLLNCALKYKLKKIIFISSGGTIYGIPEHLPISELHPTNPLCSYGITKLAIEKYLGLFKHLHGLDYIVLRLSNPFGELQRVQARQGAIAVFMGKALRNEPVEIWGDGSIIRDYIYIDDVVDALLKAINYDGEEKIFNIGSGQGRSLNQVLDSIEHLTGQSIARRYMPCRTFDVPASVLCIDRSRQLLDWTPQISFEDGLVRFFTWIKQNSIL